MKVKYLIDTLIQPNILGLDWVDLYGGMVQTINMQIDSTAEREGPIKRYPVSCDVNKKDCNNIGVLQNLVPNDSRKSIVYWEEVQPMVDRGTTKKGQFFYRNFQGTARIVVWLNLLKLGQTSCRAPIDAVLQVENLISFKGKIQGGVFDESMVRIHPKGMVKHDIQTIFGKYDYNKLKNFYLTPYDYFAIDVNFSLDQCLKKDSALIVNPSIDCLNTKP